VSEAQAVFVEAFVLGGATALALEALIERVMHVAERAARTGKWRW